MTCQLQAMPFNPRVQRLSTVSGKTATWTLGNLGSLMLSTSPTSSKAASGSVVKLLTILLLASDSWAARNGQNDLRLRKPHVSLGVAVRLRLGLNCQEIDSCRQDQRKRGRQGVAIAAVFQEVGA